MSSQAIAERAARARCDRILARIERAVAGQAADVRVERGEETLRVRGRGVRQRWITEPALRFARRIMP